MISLLKEKLFLSLVKSAKKDDVKPVPVLHLSPKNAKRVHNYRQSKNAIKTVHKLKKEVVHHKKKNELLKKDVDSLKKTVDLFASTLKKHDTRKKIASSIVDQKSILDQLRSDLKNLKTLALDAKKEKDISIREWHSISSYIEKLELVVYKKESDIDASMLL